LLATYINSCKAVTGTADDLPAASRGSFPLLFAETKAEAWAEAWATLVSALATTPEGPASDALVPVSQLIAAQLAIALPPSPNAKKIAAGTHASLPQLAAAVLAHGPDAPVLQPLTHLLPLFLFPSAALQTVEPLKAALSALATSTSESQVRAALALAPYLFDAFVESTLANRYTLYAKAAGERPTDVVVADRVRGAILPALGAALELLNSIEDGAASGALAAPVWSARLRLWDRLLAWGGYLEDERGGALVTAEAARAASALAAYGATEAGAAGEGIAGAVLRTLDALERLDHARAALDTTVVGWCLAAPPRTHAAARALLSSLLRYHQLTHSVGSFVDLLADAAAGLFDAALPPHALTAVYSLVAAGPLTDPAFVAALGAAVRATNLAGRRSAAWAGMLDDIGRRVRAALAVDDAVGGKRKRPSVADAPARLVAVLSRVASVLLDAGARAKLGDEDTEYAVGAIARAFVPDEEEDEHRSKDKKDKRKEQDGSADLVMAARMRVARAAALVAVGSEAVEAGTPVSAAITSAGGSPELALGAFRFLLTHLALNAHDSAAEHAEAVDAVLALLPGTASSAWTGRDATVTLAALPAACWTVLAQTGVAVLDTTASPAQLATLAGALVALAPSAPTSGFTAPVAVGRILSMADTWELVALRTALLRALSTSASASASASASSSDSTSDSDSSLDSASSTGGAFAVLAASPAPWLSKGARAALLDAAYAADRADPAQRAPIRGWLARLASTGVLGPLDAERLDSVLKRSDGAGASDAALALTSAALPHLVRSSLPALIENATSALAKAQKESKKGKVKEGDARAAAVPLLLAALAAQPRERFAEHETALRSLEEAARKALTPRAEAAIHSLSLSSSTIAPLEAFRMLEGYALWLGAATSQSDIGARLLAAVLRNPSPTPELAVIALDLVPRDAALAAFLLLSARSPATSLDDSFRAHVRGLSVEDYADALGAAIARASECSATEASVATALRAARILVSAPVEGSGRAIAARLAPLLAAADAAAHTPSVRVVDEALRTLGALVDERTGLLRANDAGQIIATLTAVLLPSPSPTETQPAPHLLPLAIAPLLTLARHRTDLVLAHLPAIVGSLSAALPLLQRARTRAGRRRLAARRPFWLTDNDEAPAHAAQIARTLVALCTARIAESNAPAKALAGPLGKHAPAILVSYARAAADPWAVLPASTRAELEPGLFALCDVVTAGGRADGRGREGEGVGAPFGLERDEGEREVWAELWRAWGRKRYVGRG
jgi:hypothetical protein